MSSDHFSCQPVKLIYQRAPERYFGRRSMLCHNGTDGIRCVQFHMPLVALICRSAYTFWAQASSHESTRDSCHLFPLYFSLAFDMSAGVDRATILKYVLLP